MNRLILIGNGFDLAHGLKTKYEDFILYLLHKAITKIYHEKKFVLKHLFECERVYNNLTNLSLNELLFKLNSIKSCLNFIKTSDVKFKLSNDFSKRLFDNSLNNWIDIEELYFDELKQIYKGKYTKYSTDDYLTNLNEALNSLKSELLDYISIQVKNNEVLLNDDLCKSLYSPFNLNEFMNNNYSINNALKSSVDGKFYPQNIYFLNFNYTQTFKIYINSKNLYLTNSGIGDINSTFNNIHGQIDDLESMIFGYGDEIDDDYKLIEKSRKREYLAHIKSFKYLKNRNYRDLMNFIDNADFQVYIMGHSCGLSDRVMLKRIFENDKCKSIKIFYHEQDDNGYQDFTRKCFDIALHFDDNTLMREKVVPKDMSTALGKS